MNTIQLLRICALMLPAVLFAQNGTWSPGSSSDFTNKNSWLNQTVPGADGIATFTANGNVYNANSASLGGIYVSSGTITFSGTTLALINSPILRNFGTLTFNLPLTGNGTLLTKTGSASTLFKQPLSGFSGIRIGDGEAMTPGVLSSDSPLLHAGGTLKISPTTAPVDPLATATAYTLEPGAATLFLDRGTSGTLKAQLGTTLTRQPGAALSVYSSGGAYDLGGVSKLFLPNGTANLVNGVIPWLCVLDTVTNATHKWRHLATYDAVNGVIPVTTFATDFSGGSTSVVRLDSTTETNFGATAVSASALQINGVKVIANLTLGDGTHPGVVILNPKRIASDANTPVTMLSGTLAFGTSEGIIATGEVQYGGNGSIVNSVISGSGGLTIAQPRANSYGIQSLLTLGSANTYSGPTHILGGRVYVYGVGAFGNSSEIYVHGDSRTGYGSELLIAGGNVIVTNKIYTFGQGYDGNNPGSLRVSANGSGFSGEIVLQGDTILRNCANSDTTTSTAYIYGPLTGAGDLTLYSGLTNTNGLSLFAPSTYVGNTLSRGYVYLRGKATLGQGTLQNSGIFALCDSTSLGMVTQVVNTGTFVVSTTNDTVVSVPISGTGTIQKASSGTLTFTVPVSAGNYLANNGDTFVNGGTAAFGSADTIQTVTSASAATVLLGNTATNEYIGLLSGPVTFVKTGSGTLTLSRQQTYTGNTIVSNGVLKLSANPGVPARLADISLWLDASKTSTLKLGADGVTVTNWLDQSATAANYKEDTGSPRLTLPVYNASAFNGKGGLQFTGSLTNKLNTSVSQSLRTLFIVNQATSIGGMDGLFGNANRAGDYGIRSSLSSGAGAYDWGNSQFFFTDDTTKTFINGGNSNTFTVGKAHLLSAVNKTLKSDTWAFGNYYNVGSTRAFTGNIGEVLGYPFELSVNERQLVENYLMNKWGIRSASASDILPVSTALTLADTGTLDLNGLNQSFASIVGSGRIINSGAAANLTLNSDVAVDFAGTVSGSNTLIKTGSGTLSVMRRQEYLGGTVINSGTIKLAVTLPTNGLVVALDAGSVTTNASGQVTAWNSANGSGNNYTVPTDFTAPKRILDSALNLPAVQFDGISNRIYNSSTVNLQSLVALNRVEGYPSQFAGLFGGPGDYGLRMSGETTWQASGDTYFIFPGDGGSMYINGVSGYSFSVNVPHIVTAISGTSNSRPGTSLGWYYGNAVNPNRFYKGSVYEMLIYNRAITQNERATVENYLNLKWLQGGLKNLLPTNALYIAAGATLDLGGTTQSVGALSGSGSIVNGTLALTGEFTVTVNANGTCTPYTSAASLDLSKATLRLVNSQYLRGGAQTLVEVTGTTTLTGVPAFANLPAGWRVRLEGKLLRIYPGATLILLH